jgi:ribosome-associated protein
MFQINDQISIPESDLVITFVQSSGPGGQNVNKVASQAQLRFNTHSAALPEEVRERLIQFAKNRITDEGILIINAKRFRSQERNRLDAIDRLANLIHQAAVPPKKRKKTQPTQASKEKRLETKRRQSELKRQRRESFDRIE